MHYNYPPLIHIYNLTYLVSIQKSRLTFYYSKEKFGLPFHYRKAASKLRSSGTVVAPHRARCNEARRAKLRRAKVWGKGISTHGHRRCPTITNSLVWYYRTSSMPVMKKIYSTHEYQSDICSKKIIITNNFILLPIEYIKSIIGKTIHIW